MRNRRGSATIMGLGVLLLVGMLIAALLPWTTAESRFGRNDQDAVQARYAAEAGLKRALAEFALTDKNWGWLNNPQQLTDTLGQATYTVTISPSPAAATATGQYNITSTGAAGAAGNVMTRVSKMPAVEYKAGGFYATYAGGTLNVGGGTVVMNGGQIGYGVKPFNDTVTCLDSNGITQATNSCVVYAPSAPLPTYNIADYRNKGYPAPPTDNATLTQKKYYSDTSINSNQVTWTGAPDTTTIIFINGDASFKNGMTIRAGANGAILVYATGNITFQNNAILEGAAVMAGGNIILKNNTQVDGALIAAGSVTFNNNSITYNANIVSALNLTTYTSGINKVTAATWEK